MLGIGLAEARLQMLAWFGTGTWASTKTLFLLVLVLVLLVVVVVVVAVGVVVVVVVAVGVVVGVVVVSNIMHTSHVCVTLTSRIYFLLTLAQGKKAAPGWRADFS